MAGMPLINPSGAVSSSGVTFYLLLDAAPVDVYLGGAQSVFFLKPLNTRLIFVASGGRHSQPRRKDSPKQGYPYWCTLAIVDEL